MKTINKDFRQWLNISVSFYFKIRSFSVREKDEHFWIFFLSTNSLTIHWLFTVFIEIWVIWHKQIANTIIWTLKCRFLSILYVNWFLFIQAGIFWYKSNERKSYFLVVKIPGVVPFRVCFLKTTTLRVVSDLLPLRPSHPGLFSRPS